MTIRQTHTFSLLSVPPEVYNDIRARLKAAGYGHAFLPDGDGRAEVIDMHGIALAPDASEQQAPAHAVASIAAILGWGNVPPLATLERDLLALKGQVVAELVDLSEWIHATFDMGADRSQVADARVLALRDVVAQICERIHRRRVGQPLSPDQVTGGHPCGHPKAYARSEDGTTVIVCLQCRVDTLVDFVRSNVGECPRCPSCRDVAKEFLAAYDKQPTSRRQRLLERARDLGYELSTYAASARTDRTPNTKDWLRGLFDLIERTQQAAKAAGVEPPPGMMQQERPRL